MSHEIKHNIKQQSTWKRGLYIMLFSIFYQIAILILFVTIVFQFVLKLLTDDTNEQLRQLSQRIGRYIFQIIQFMSFNSDYKPYPFGEWPEDEPKVAGKPKSGESDIDEALKKIDQDNNVDGD